MQITRTSHGYPEILGKSRSLAHAYLVGACDSVHDTGFPLRFSYFSKRTGLQQTLQCVQKTAVKAVTGPDGIDRSYFLHINSD